jgi:rhamnosyltransferase
VITYQPDTGLGGRLAAIAAQCEHVIVVDNASSADALATVPKGIEIVPQQTNIGLAAALNVGLERARSFGFLWALTFDQDSTPEEGMVAALWATHSRHVAPARVAVVGPRLREERVEHEDHRWVVPHPRCRLLFHRAPCRSHDLPGVAFVITSGSLLNLTIFGEVGVMDEGLFIDYIDHDYCLRARRAGFDIVVSAEACLRHNLGAKQEFQVAGKAVRPTFHSALRLRYMCRNRVRLWWRYAWVFPHWALFDGVFTPYNLLRVILFEDHRLAKLRAAIRGTCDGLLGRSGMIRQ